MPRFEPFAGLRYADTVDLAAATSPPYDVIDPDERAALAARHDRNVVRIDMPVDGDDPYAEAAATLARWQADGTLVTDDAPSFYAYRMTYVDEQDNPRDTTGILGGLGLEPPGEGDVLPHEHTTPKAKSDRLDLLRSTHHNLSPIWGLSLATGLSALVDISEPPLAEVTDELGVVHALWRVTDEAVIASISGVVASAPVVIADGHHRFETSLAYRNEVRAANGDQAGPWDLTLALVVELTEDELAVRPIHRLLDDLPGDVDLSLALAPFFDIVPAPEADLTLTDAMAELGALALVREGGHAWLLRPRPEAFPDDMPDLDSSRLDVARATLGDHRVTYQHGTDNVLRKVAAGEAAAGVLLRPATVAQIEAMAHRRERMPPKTTYFHPKIRTGMLFRSLEA
ncbi:MAG TPA: DUF1015 domain-containing protein [Acidimicrobiales bacterium]|nr:DUF1015 domain-containing protein [Acidimicrobiales bacterium]